MKKMTFLMNKINKSFRLNKIHIKLMILIIYHLKQTGFN
jgi:hypothetical protein